MQGWHIVRYAWFAWYQEMLVRPFGALALAAVAASLSSSPVLSESAPHNAIRVGMTITEVQTLMGPPHAIKSLRDREAIFYCPNSWADLLFGDRTYTIVWLYRRRVVAAQTSQPLQRLTCENVLASFQWTDPVPVDARSVFGMR